MVKDCSCTQCQYCEFKYNLSRGKIVLQTIKVKDIEFDLNPEIDNGWKNAINGEAAELKKCLNGNHDHKHRCLGKTKYPWKELIDSVRDHWQPDCALPSKEDPGEIPSRPFLVVKSNGRYFLQNGRHRLTVLYILDIEEVEVYVKGD